MAANTVCPAECKVLRYGDGLPIEQTRSRRGCGIAGRMARADISGMLKISSSACCGTDAIRDCLCAGRIDNGGFETVFIFWSFEQPCEAVTRLKTKRVYDGTYPK